MMRMIVGEQALPMSGLQCARSKHARHTSLMQYTRMMDDNDDNGSDDVVLTIDAEIVYDMIRYICLAIR